MQQGNSSVEAYNAQFYRLAAQTKAKWNDDIMVTMYRRGLHPQIAIGLCNARLPTLDDAVHIAYQVEVLKGIQSRQTFPNSSQVMSQVFENPISKTVSRPQSSGATTTTSRPARTTSPPRVHNFDGFTQRGGASYHQCG